MLYRARVKRLAYQLNLRLEERVQERARIARELHDTLLQSLHGLILRFQAAYNMLPTKPGEGKQALKIAIDRAARTITDSRDAVHELRSQSRGSTDLVQAITALGDELTATSATDLQAPFQSGENSSRNESGNGTVKYQVLLEGSPKSLYPILRDDPLSHRTRGRGKRIPLSAIPRRPLALNNGRLKSSLRPSESF
jgi:signal transduction histidine kinase